MDVHTRQRQRRTGSERRTADLGPPDGVERRNGERRRQGDRRRTPTLAIPSDAPREHALLRSLERVRRFVDGVEARLGLGARRTDERV